MIVTEGSHQYVIGTRPSVDNGKITAIDSLVSDKGDWLFNANAYLKYSSKEDWSAPKASAGRRCSSSSTPETITSTCSPTSS